MAVVGPCHMDVVFSFDTTGSMSLALDEVKGRINDIIQKLQADIPGVKIGIIAHGDYCDAEHFYDIRSLELSDNLPDLVTFVSDTEGTGGGDTPECYELALQYAKNMPWRIHSRRVLVVIGDAYPHEPDYHLNVQNIDWKRELSDLAAMNVCIYGVQVKDDQESTQFFQQLTLATGGQHLRLADMGRVCEVVMGICYREQGPAMFKNFEAEIRHREAEKFDCDLECVFGTLRHEVSRTSDVTAILDEEVDDDDVDMFDERTKKRRISTTDDVRPGLKRVYFDDDDDDNVDSSDEIPRKKRRISGLDNNTQTTPQKPTITAVVMNTTTTQSKQDNLKTRPKTRRCVKKLPTKLRKPYREHVIASRFEFNFLPWSQWHLAACPKQEMKKKKEGRWKTVLRQNSSDSLWRSDLWDCIPARHRQRRMIFELSIQTHGSHRRKVVSFHVTRPVASRGNGGVFRLPWYRGVFRNIRPVLNRAVCQNSKVFIRWTPVMPRNQKVCRDLGEYYNYAWRPGTQRSPNPRLSFH